MVVINTLKKIHVKKIFKIIFLRAQVIGKNKYSGYEKNPVKNIL